MHQVVFWVPLTFAQQAASVVRTQHLTILYASHYTTSTELTQETYAKLLSFLALLAAIFAADTQHSVCDLLLHL